MKIVGITGGVGSGKSEILTYIGRNFDAQVVKADEVAHLLMSPGRVCYPQIVQAFGDAVIREDKGIDRKKLAAVVYQDPEQLQKLNGIVHPEVKKYILRSIERERKNETAYFFIEAALLLEDNYDAICDELWYIYTDEDARRKRLKLSREYTDARIDEIMANQLSEDEFSERCDFEIDNSGDFAHTIEQINQRMSRL